MAATILDGKATSAEIREQVKADVSAFQAISGLIPHLQVLLVGANPASHVYVRNKQKACTKVGITGTVQELPAETTQEQLLETIRGLNESPTVHGILVQLPLPDHIDEQAVLDAIHPLKDVDAFHPENVGLLVQERPRFQPCTPAGCLELLKKYEITTTGKHAVVLGRSEIVGKPMANLLLHRGDFGDATVTVCHSGTPDLAQHTVQADLLIVGIGKPNFITADVVKPGAVVIDVGINRLAGELVGDVEYAGVSQIASAITPVPGGVGPMTVAMLMRNTLTAAKLQNAN